MKKVIRLMNALVKACEFSAFCDMNGYKMAGGLR